MALLNIDTGALAKAVNTTAASRIIREVSQAASPKLLRDVQNVMGKAGLIGRALGLSTGVGALDGVLGLTAPRDQPSPLLGGLSLRQAQAIHEMASTVRTARKNLWFVRVSDRNPPAGNYRSSSSGGLFESRVGPIVRSALSPGSVVAGVVAGAAGGGVSVADTAISTFDLLAMDVSYGIALLNDTDQIGSTFVDRPTGRAPSDVQITTLDDEAGTLKKWFEAKQRQVAAPDGTFGLPADYLLDLEIVHAIPSDKVEGYSLAYASKMAVRAQSMQLDLSRRDQALAEVQLQFSEFDPFMRNGA